MKASLGYAILILLVLIAFSCSKKMSEKDYYLKATENMEQENYEEAEKFFAKILEDYPNGENSSKALFMIGFINANYLNNLDKAKTYYTEFLEKYPDHELAKSATYEIDHLGQDIDDLPFLQGEPATDQNKKDKQASSNPTQ
jgi:outer membrane protein assembly factor BamD (BamD/ComL family)